MTKMTPHCRCSSSHWLMTYAVTWLMASVVAAENSTDVLFSPKTLLLKTEGTVHTIYWNTTVHGVASVDMTSSNTMVASIIELNETYWEPVTSSNVTAQGSFNISADFVGYSIVTLTLRGEEGEELASAPLKVSVLVAYQSLNDWFINSIAVLLGLIYINMGATIKMNIVKKILKKPIGPVIGLCCQYVAMPLIAFGLSQLLFPEEPLYQLGTFLSGCCPGGGNSNMWTHILKGNLDLSVTMTFVSTLIAFIAVPAWVFILGPYIAGQADFVIPFVNIALIIVSLLIPCAIGILIKRFLPRVALFLERMLTSFAIFILVYTFSFGIYANRFMFSIVSFKMSLCGFLLPAIGYLIGMIAAKLFRLPTGDIIAIGVETGIQNTTIAALMIGKAVEQPAATIGIIMPGSVFLMTPVPLLLIHVIKICIEKRRKYNEEKLEEAGQENKDKDKVAKKSSPPIELPTFASFTNSAMTPDNVVTNCTSVISTNSAMTPDNVVTNGTSVISTTNSSDFITVKNSKAIADNNKNNTGIKTISGFVPDSVAVSPTGFDNPAAQLTDIPF